MRKLFVAAATVANFALLVTPGVRRQVAEKGTARVAPDRRRPRTRASRSRTTVTSLAWNGRLGDHSRRNRRLGVTDEPRLVLPGPQNGDGINQWPNDGGDLVYAEMRLPNEELAPRRWRFRVALEPRRRRVLGRSLRLRLEGRRRVDPPSSRRSASTRKAETHPSWIVTKNRGPTLQGRPSVCSSCES